MAIPTATPVATPVASQLDQLIRVNASAAASLTLVQKHVEAIAARIKGGGAAGTPRAGATAGTFAQITKTVGKFAAALGIAVGILSSIPAAVTGIVAAATPFVAALSPASVQAFQYEIANLRATIGTSLTPVIGKATASVREWAGILLPAMRELKPLVDRIANAFSNYSAGAVRALVNLLVLVGRVLEPFVDQIAQIMDEQGQLIEVYAALIRTLADSEDVIAALRGLLEAFLGPLPSLREMVHNAARGFALLTARVMQLVGAFDTLKKFRERIEKAIADRKRPPGGAVAAPFDPRVGSIEDVARQFAERAFIATSADSTRKTEVDLLEQIAADLKEAELNPIGWRDVIKMAVREAILETPLARAGSAVADAPRLMPDMATSPVGRAVRRTALTAGLGLGGVAIDTVAGLFE
jgi:hypothetical protein